MLRTSVSLRSGLSRFAQIPAFSVFGCLDEEGPFAGLRDSSSGFRDCMWEWGLIVCYSSPQRFPSSIPSFTLGRRSGYWIDHHFRSLDRALAKEQMDVHACIHSRTCTCMSIYLPPGAETQACTCNYVCCISVYDYIW